MANPGIKGTRVYKQIEEDADYYEPSIYSALGFTSLFQALDDPAKGDFIPVSSPLAYKFGESGATGRMFVVGLLPPTCNVSGRFLDRSASVAHIQGGVGAADLGTDADPSSTGGGGVQKYGGVVTAPGYKIPKGTGSSNTGKGYPPGVQGCGDKVAVEYLGDGKYKYNCVANVSIPEMYQAFHDAYVAKFGREPTPTEIQFITAHCFRETGGHMPGNNPGYIGNRATNPGGWVGFQEPDPKNPGSTRTRWFKGYDSVADGCAAYLNAVARNPNVLAAARDGDVLGYLTSLAQQGYYVEPVRWYYNNNGRGGGWPSLLNMVAAQVPSAGLGRADNLPKDAPNNCAFNESTAQYQKRAKAAGLRSGAAAISRFNKDSPYGPDCPLAGNEGNPNEEYVTPDWEGKGAANAQTAKTEEAKTAGQDLNRTSLGQTFLWQQSQQQRDTIRQLEIMRNTPPLRLLVNPESFKVAAEKIVSDGNWTRNGPVIEHWGDGQDKITGSGKIAGFYSIDAQNATGPGLSRTTRNYSMAYQNFLSLWLLYRNNGGLVLQDYTAGEDSPLTNISVTGSIYIYYDGIIYIGSFDSFNVNETDAAPFTLEYDFQFTVRAWYELDRDDPSQYQYGSTSGMFKQGGIPVVPDTQKTYEASVAAGEARKAEAKKPVDARNRLDSLFQSPEQLLNRGGK